MANGETGTLTQDLMSKKALWREGMEADGDATARLRRKATSKLVVKHDRFG